MTSTSPQTPPAAASLHTPVIGWFEQHARDLPWRRPEAGAWGVMVSEFMLQQTPVSRVLPVYEQWLARWPRPADLAAEAPGEAVRAWGRLRYGVHRVPQHRQQPPAHEGPPRKGQTYAGTDRQVRGRLLAVLRDAVNPVPQAALDAVWEEPVQRARALDGLVADGLVEPLADGRYRLPLT
ncbi:hypothetical protein JHN62_33875 [Streptomyces sp. MBT54]|nr:hypothetical protein [Streptomyces sp. MBT54]